MEHTKVTVTVRFEVEYDGKVRASDIDAGDIIRDPDAIKNVKIKTKAVKATFHPITGWGVRI